MKTHRLQLITLVISAALLASCTSTGNTVREQPITIGYVGPLTGDAAAWGQDDLDALRLAVDEVNAQGGINGRPMQLIVEDGKCTGKDAATATRKLIDVHDVQIIRGGGCSSETLAMIPITEEEGVVLFSSLSSAPKISEQGEYVFRNTPTDTDYGAATARLAYRNGVRNISVVYEQTSYAQGFAEVFSSEFERLGGTVIDEQGYSSQERDFRTLVASTRTHNPQAVLLSPQHTTGGLVAKQLREQGYRGPLYANAGLSTQEAIEKYGEYIEGIYYSEAAQLDRSNPQAAHFLDTFNKTYGRNPIWEYYPAASYDSGHLLAQATQHAGYDAEAIKNYLYDMDEYSGAVGTYWFDARGDVQGIRFADKRILDGKQVTLT